MAGNDPGAVHRKGAVDSEDVAGRVHWLTLYTSMPMGQQTYRTSIRKVLG